MEKNQPFHPLSSSVNHVRQIWAHSPLLALLPHTFALAMHSPEKP